MQFPKKNSADFTRRKESVSDRYAAVLCMRGKRIFIVGAGSVPFLYGKKTVILQA